MKLRRVLCNMELHRVIRHEGEMREEQVRVVGRAPNLDRARCRLSLGINRTQGTPTTHCLRVCVYEKKKKMSREA